MPNILAIETSTDACSVALLVDTEIKEKFVLAPRQQAQIILPMIDALLKDAQMKLNQLHAIAFGAGPGSFTGIRIAASVVQGLAFPCDLPVILLSTLAIMAQGAYRTFNTKRAVVAIDARMNEVYWGGYQLDEINCMRPVIADQLSKPVDLFFSKDQDWFGMGNAWKIYPEVGQKISVYANAVDFYPHAQDAVRLAVLDWQNSRFVKAENALPIYLRGTGAWKKENHLLK